MAEWLGDAPSAASLAAMHLRCAAAYNVLFWNSSLSLYGDWSDTGNRTRFYGYIWQQSLAADPIAGIADAPRAAAMASAVQARLAEIRIQYARPWLWCAPTNLWGVDPPDSFYNGTLQDQAEYGHCEYKYHLPSNFPPPTAHRSPPTAHRPPPTAHRPPPNFP